MKFVNLNESPEMLAALATWARLNAELAAVEYQIAVIEDAQRTHAETPRDPLSDAIALMDGTRIEPSNSAELGRLCARRDAVSAGARAASERALITRANLSLVYMAAQTPKVIAALDALAAALQAALDAGQAFNAIRADAAELGYDSTAGSLPLEIADAQREPIQIHLRAVRDLSAELTDRVAPDGPDVTVIALAELHGHDAQPGDTVTLPGKVARQLVRLGRAEVATASARPRKPTAKQPTEVIWGA